MSVTYQVLLFYNPAPYSRYHSFHWFLVANLLPPVTPPAQKTTNFNWFLVKIVNIYSMTLTAWKASSSLLWQISPILAETFSTVSCCWSNIVISIRVGPFALQNFAAIR